MPKYIETVNIMSEIYTLIDVPFWNISTTLHNSTNVVELRNSAHEILRANREYFRLLSEKVSYIEDELRISKERIIELERQLAPENYI
jgi:hypothetical protein